MTLLDNTATGQEIVDCVSDISSADPALFSLVEVTCSDSATAEYQAEDITIISNDYQCATGYMVNLQDDSKGCGKTRNKRGRFRAAGLGILVYF